MYNCDLCGHNTEAQIAVTDKLNEQIGFYEERFKAYESQFEEMDKEIHNLETKVQKLELEGLKIQAERDGIVQYTTDLIARLKGQPNEINETNNICETQDKCPPVLEDRRGQIESQNPDGLSTS